MIELVTSSGGRVRVHESKVDYWLGRGLSKPEPAPAPARKARKSKKSQAERTE